MSSILIEHGQYVDASGKPIVGGKLYVGTNGSDPVTTSASTIIYSDRELTTPISNPQTLDSNGRSTNKIWVSGKYSLQVNSVVGMVETQEFQDLDAGSSSSSELILGVSSVVGGDIITGSTDSAISSYANGQQFVFTVAAVNTGPVTLNIDGVGAKAVVFNVSEPLEAGAFAVGQEVIVIYSSANDNFDWVNQKTDLVRDTSPQLGGALDANSHIIQASKGADVASAAELPLGTDGNSFDITGTTTITSIVDIAEGTIVTLQFDASLTLTHDTPLRLPGETNIQTGAGDVGIFQQASATVWRCISYSKAEGPFIKAWVNFNGAGTVAIKASFNVSSITDNGLGDYTVLFTNDTSDADYGVLLSVAGADLSRNATIKGDASNIPTSKTIAGVNIETGLANSGANLDLADVNVAIIR